MSLKQESQNKAFGGSFTKYSFTSEELGGTEAKFNLFIPGGASSSKQVPILYYLAGLTCTEDTGAQKGAFLATAASHNIAVCFPDTSPRGAKVPGEDDDWDLGTGAGFYLTATKGDWKGKYNMYEHVLKELPSLIEKEGLGVDGSKVSIFGHSMGGHGALSLYLKNPGHFKSASGFAPICNPSQCQWGQKAFSNYLSDSSEWSAYDSTLLLADYPKDQPLNVKIVVGTGDKFYKDGQLLPENFIKALKESGREKDVQVQLEDGYDHSYYFVSSFGAEHVEYHAKFLNA